MTSIYREKNFCPFSEYIDIIIYSGIGQKLKYYILYIYIA